MPMLYPSVLLPWPLANPAYPPTGPSEPDIAWPSTAQLLAARGTHRWSAWLKTGARQWLSRPHRSPLLAALRQCPAWAARFGADARYFHSASSHFLDRRLGAAERMVVMANDLQQAAWHLPAALQHQLASGEPVRLWSLNDEVHLCLGWNDVSYHEGLWALSLRDGAGRRLYYLSFSFQGQAGLLVPTLQGPAQQDDDARALVRQLTKQAEGLRPQHLLLAGLRAACALWSIERLAGIAPANHVKGRWNLRGKRLRFDYAALWQELGGWPAADGHWTLPLQAEARDAATIPSQKRAMYRRRQALLDSLQAAMQQQLAPPQALSLAA